MRTFIVIPAKAGTHLPAPETAEKWVPAFAGTTIRVQVEQMGSGS